MLFNWILNGFNSNLTDVDVENITQFILKYISCEDDVETLMDSLLTSLKDLKKHLLETEDNLESVFVQKKRKGCLKKAYTLSKIITHLSKYYLKKVDFIESFINILSEIFNIEEGKSMIFISKENEYTRAEGVKDEDSKTEAEIFHDIITNSLNIIIASYGFFKLSTSDVMLESIKEEIKKQEEAKGEEKKEKKEESKDTKKEVKSKAISSKYDQSIINYFISIEAFPEEEQIDIEKHLEQWKTKFSEAGFLKFIMSIVDYSNENFDHIFTHEKFNKLLYFLNKLLEEKENTQLFIENNGFKKLLSCKSKKMKSITDTKGCFTDIVIKLVENDDALLEITENTIKKCFYFKHDEEFSKEIKDKSKDGAKKKKDGKRSKDKKSKDDAQVDKKEDLKDEAKTEKIEEEKHHLEPQIEESVEHAKTTTQIKSMKSNPNLLKKSDIYFSSFKNCSGVKLAHFVDQMKSIQMKSPKIFLQA